MAASNFDSISGGGFNTGDVLGQTIIGGSVSGGNSFVDPRQQQFLDQIRGRGLFQLRNIQGSPGFGDVPGGGQTSLESGFSNANQLSGAGQGFLGNLGNIGDGTAANAQIQSLTDLLNQNLDRSLQGIGQQSALGNTFGGGRQGVAQGQAIQGNQLALGSGIADILDQQQNQQLSANLGGQSSLGGLFDLSQAGFNNAFAPLQNLAALVGPPTVLNRNASQESDGALNSFGGFLGGLF